MLIFHMNFEYFLGLTAMQTEHRTIPVEVLHMPRTDPGLSKGGGGGGHHECQRCKCSRKGGEWSSEK